MKEPAGISFQQRTPQPAVGVMKTSMLCLIPRCTTRLLRRLLSEECVQPQHSKTASRACPGARAAGRVSPAAAREKDTSARDAFTTRDKGLRLAQKIQVGPCIPVGIQL